jgi:hypothetical protein
MEPASALAVAGNVLQFVEFISKLISKTLQIYKSDDGSSKDRRLLESHLKDFILLNARLSSDTRGRPTLEVETNTEGVDNVVQHLVGHAAVLGQNGLDANGARDPIQDIAIKCSQIANELVVRLERMKLKGNPRVWASLKAALADMWKTSELDELQRNLAVYKQQLELHVLISLR